MNIILLVKLALNKVDDVKALIKKHLLDAFSHFENDESNLGLKKLIEMKNDIFPESGQASLDPEDLNPEFADFLGDNGMWSWISSAENRKLSYEDKLSVDMIKDSIKDLVDRNVLFSDVNVEESFEDE